MIKDKLIESVRLAYNFGIEQTNKRIEPRDTIISWCGYSKLPKAHKNTIYAAYKSGLHNRKNDKVKYRLFIVTDEKLAILTDEHGQIYKLAPPYKSPKKVTYETYCEILYGGVSAGVVHNTLTFKELDKIKKEIEGEYL